jgi:hypothetical protein
MEASPPYVHRYNALLPGAAPGAVAGEGTALLESILADVRAALAARGADGRFNFALACRQGKRIVSSASASAAASAAATAGAGAAAAAARAAAAAAAARRERSVPLNPGAR